MFYRLLLIGSSLISTPVFGQQVLHLQEGQVSPKANIEQISWIEGYWSCEIWGGVAEELWLNPTSHSMECIFRFLDNDSIVFIELVSVQKKGNSLSMEIKHFDSKLHGWEKADETISFPLIYLEPGRAYFDGITYLLTGPDQLDVIVELESASGEKEEAIFNYKRVLHK